MKALIDADIIVYKAGFGAQSESKDIPVSYSLHNARSLLRKTVESLRVYFDIDTVTLFLTSDDKSNFRFEVAKTQKYKGNRTLEKPVHYCEIRDYLVENFKAEMIYGEEADDAIGKRSTELGTGCVIVSSDKDLRMLPGWHWEMGDRHPFYSTELGFLQLERRKGRKPQLFGTGTVWFFAQCLLGDTADNIPGVSGYGHVKTFNALKDVKTIDEGEEILEKIYKEKNLSLERLEEVKDLLWILR